MHRKCAVTNKGGDEMVFAVAPGAWIFLAAIVVVLVAVVWGYYSRTGSDISQTPYDGREGQEGAAAPSDLAHDHTQHAAEWGHGTAGHHGGAHARPAANPRLADVGGGAVAAGHLAVDVGPTDHLRGDEGAGVVVVYGSYVSEDTTEAERIVAGLAGSGRLAEVWRHLPHTEDGLSLACAAESASELGDFWAFHDALIAHGRGDVEARVRHAAKAAGLDADRVLAEPALAAARERVLAQREGGEASGANGLPTLFVSGERFDDEVDEAGLQSALAR
jgi:DSBA-like thioredoxin domain